VWIRTNAGATLAIAATDTGNVGIGTASPAANLHVYKASGVGVTVESGSGTVAIPLSLVSPANTLSMNNRGDISFSLLDSSAYQLGIRTLAAQPIFFATNGTERARIDSAGNFGIGTASPWAKMAMVATNNISTISFGFSFDNTNNYRHGISTVFSSSSTTGNLMSFCVSDATATGFTRVLTLNGAGQAALGTTSFTTGRALTTVADLDVFGVRVGRGSGDDAESTAVGNNALPSQQAGQKYNTAIGRSALGSLTTAESNSAVGHAALYNIGGGNQNVALGRSAGRYYGAGSGALATATNSVFIGFESRANADSESNQIVIGASAIGNGSNTTTIGNSSTVGTFFATKYTRIVTAYTVATLPAAGTVGREARVSDGDAGLAWGATVVNTGAGATPYHVWDHGTNWTVVRK